MADSKKKITLSFSQEDYRYLEQLAQNDKRPIASMAQLIIQQRIEQAIASGELQPAPIESDSDIAALIAKLIDGEALEPEEEQRLAELCDRAPHNVHTASKRIQGKKNGKEGVNASADR